jgi:hypothetical protein
VDILTNIVQEQKKTNNVLQNEVLRKLNEIASKEGGKDIAKNDYTSNNKINGIIEKIESEDTLSKDTSIYKIWTKSQ